MCDLSYCVSEIKTCMDHNRFKMNDSETEFILFGSRKQLAKCIRSGLDVNGNNILRSECICYLAKWMDQDLSFKTHIQIACKSATFNLFRLCKICSVDTREMQRIQNMAAKIVLRAPKYSSLMECTKELHWLPICFWKQHKILTLVYKTLHGHALDYMKSMLSKHIPSRSGLRSEQLYKMLCILCTQRKTFAAKSFSVAGPTYWNALPEDVKKSKNVATFKQKPCLFKIAFNIY